MSASLHKREYKVISLFIKSVILFFSFYYIYCKLNEPSATLDFSSLFSGNNSFLILLVFVLMFLNWGLEALKWKRLVAPLESISFSNSLKSIFAGITISIFTPNRVGEFAGRVFFLNKADKIQASLMSLIGSFMQLVVTVIAGLIAYYILENRYYDYFQIEQFISSAAVLSLLLLLIAFIVTAVIVLIVKADRFPRIKKYMDVFKMYSKNELDVVFYFSVIRYIVFSIQYYLVLQVFGITGGITIVFSLIALTFFVTSAIPTFALTEIAVRAGVAVYFLGTINSTHTAIVASSLFLWIINLAIPALIGAAFVWKLKIFKDKE